MFTESLLSPKIRIMAPFIKVTIGTYTFGVYNRTAVEKDSNGFYKAMNIQYPNFVQSLYITKINGKVNQYSLSISYPVTPEADPNFFEKVLSSVSGSRKIQFTYGDSSQPKFIYKEEDAIITKCTSSFSFGSGGSSTAVINYNIQAISTIEITAASSFNFINSEPKYPSEEIKRIFNDPRYGLQEIFTGMTSSTLDKFIEGGDKKVQLSSMTSTSPLDYLKYLVSCMQPNESISKSGLNSAIYILTIHDAIDVEDDLSSGTYFKVTRTDKTQEHPEAYSIDIGYNTASAVTSFSINSDESYSMFYEYDGKLKPRDTVKRLTRNGEEEDVFSRTITSSAEQFISTPEELSWWTKITQFPIKGTLRIIGLLRPATLMTYLRINVIFPGAGGEDTRKHISSGLYIITSQRDEISASGYFTTLELTKIGA